MDLSNDDVQDVLRLLDALPYDELRLATERFTLTFRRSPAGGWTEEREVHSSPNVVEPSPAVLESFGPAAPTTRSGDSAESGNSTGSGDPEAGGPARDGLLEVRAPLLGTFYRAPKPGAPPFVEVGSRVQEDTVIGLVETMKLFTSVYARVRGTVAEVCLADARFAHEGAVLMRVAPERP